MSHMRHTLIVLTAILAGITNPVAAANFSFLKNSIPNSLSASDMDQLTLEAGRVLDQKPDTTITRWQAPESGVLVKILPKLSYSEAGVLCRRTLMNFSAKGKHPETFGFTLCKKAGDQWKITESRLQSLGEDDVRLVESHARQALESTETGTPVTWFNPETRVNGTAIVVNTDKSSTPGCKNLALSLFDSDGTSLEGLYVLCKKDGDWKRRPL